MTFYFNMMFTNFCQFWCCNHYCEDIQFSEEKSKVQVQVLVIRTQIDNLLLQLAQKLDYETSLLRDPQSKSKLWKNILENRIRIFR
jgi:hypothetical protein